MESRRAGLYLFLGMMALYMAFFGGHYVVGDHTYRMAWARALLRDGGHDISSFIPGTTYSKYGFGHTLLHVPLIAASNLIRRMTGIACEGPLNMLLYPINGALGCLILQRIWISNGLTNAAATWRAVLVGVTTVWFPYTKLEDSDPLVATSILAMWCWAPRRALLSGLVGGLAVSFRFDALPWTLWTATVSPGNRAKKLRVIVGLLPGLALALWSNWLRTGTLHLSGYQYEAGFDNPVWVGIYGMLFSAGRSVFLYSPLLILGWWSLPKAYSRPETRRLAVWAGGLFVGQLALYGAWWDWSGDDSWGPQFMIVSTLAMLTVVLQEQSLRSWIVWLLVALGLCVELPPVLLGPHTSLNLQIRQRPTKIDLYIGTTSPITNDDAWFHPRYSQVVATWELVRYKLTGGVPHARSPNATGTTWLEGFREPPRIEWDLFWLNLRRRGAGAAQGAASPVSRMPPSAP